MAKKALLLICLISFSFGAFAQTQKIKFVKGNISEKTAAVREATGDEGIWLSNEAIKFVLTNKALLGNDRELDGLAVAAILSIPVEYTKLCSDAEKQIISDQLMELFIKFGTSNTVQIAVLSKLLQLKDILPVREFTQVLNKYISDINIAKADSSVIKATLNALEFIGNKDTFIILYNYYNDSKYITYKNELENTVAALLPLAANEVLTIIHENDSKKTKQIYELIQKNTNISKNFMCEIAENVLNEAILQLDNSSKYTAEMIQVRLYSLKILSENKWTRASATCLSYFVIAKKEFEYKLMSEKDFCSVISALFNVAPIDSINVLNMYLEELNRQTEKGEKVSSEVVMAVIKTLGAIGDKSAFDSLLAVTYLVYPEEVLSAAREALAGLRW